MLTRHVMLTPYETCTTKCNRRDERSFLVQGLGRESVAGLLSERRLRLAAQRRGRTATGHSNGNSQEVAISRTRTGRLEKGEQDGRRVSREQRDGVRADMG